MRVLVVHLPAFRLERCGYEASDLAALIAEERSAMRLQALTPAALHAGLRPFMTATEARALAPEVELIPVEPEGEQHDRAALVRHVQALSDRVRAPWPDTLVAEVTGSAHLFGGEGGLVARATELVRGLGHRSMVVLTDDPLAGRALARWGRGGVVAPGAAGSALASLPLEALEPSEGLRGALRAVGIDTIGAFARLAPASVASRFGEEGARLQRVARGEAVSERVASEDDAENVAVRATLGGATTTLQLHFALPGLLAELAERLGERGLAVVRARVVLHLEQGAAEPVVGFGVTVGRPTRDPVTLERAIRLRLEGASLSGPVDELRIEVIEAAPELGWQPGLTDRTEATEPLPDLLARLGDHLGDAALMGARLADRWRPETSWEPQLWPPRRLTSRLRAVPPFPLSDPVARQEGPHVAVARPTLLLPAPCPVEVRVACERPQAWRSSEGWLPVHEADGPERLTSEWWSHERWSRDYWVVRSGDVWAWLFLSTPDGGWFLHGYFD